MSALNSSKNIAIFSFSVVATTLLSLIISGCAGEKFFDQLATTSTNSLSGYIIVASSTSAGGAAGSSGAVAMFDTAGVFVRSLRDLYDSIEFPAGLAYIGTNTLVTAIDGTDRLELGNILTGSYSTYGVAPGITGAPTKHMAVDTSNSIYVSEYAANTIEKVDSTGTRVGNPFITGGGSCVLNNVYGITYIPTADRIAAVSFSAGNLSFFNAQTGACITSVNNAAYTTQSPTAILYHTQTNKLLIARVGDERIYAANVDGSSPVIAYSSARITDPYAMAVDSSGFVYVGASTQDTIEKLSFSGTTLTHVSAGPLIGPNVYTQNPTQIVVVP